MASTRQLPLVSLPVIALVVSNVFPIAGVIFFEWKVFDLVALYWCENAIIGVINVFKMLTTVFVPTTGEPWRKSVAKRTLEALLMIPFFVAHYGGFLVAHGVFVAGFMGSRHVLGDGSSAPLIAMAEGLLSRESLVAVGALSASHLLSFLYHFLLGREYAHTNISKLLVAPYARVALLHLAIFGGGIGLAALGSPMPLLVALVIGKIVLDVKAHRRSHAVPVVLSAG